MTNTNIHARLPETVLGARIKKIQTLLKLSDIEAMLVSANANIYYTSGRVFSGYVYIPCSGEAMYFVRRPVGLDGNNVFYINKPEQLPEIFSRQGINMPSTLGLELDLASVSAVERLSRVFTGAQIKNASSVMRTARSVKDAYELALMRESGNRHVAVYSQIPSLYRSGMTDVQLQIEIERILRLNGCLGQFRISGDTMELFMGNLLCGDNADNPAPYDFAMGGAGLDTSLPVGCNGSEIKNGMSVMVDMNGNFTGYMTDMTRVYSVGELSPIAEKAHNCSRRIVKELSEFGVPGVEAKMLYERALDIAKEENLEQYFMGHRQKAGFVGHGVGIEVNELPVIAPRSRDILAEGNTIALEPKFVIPGVGAVGVENTYVVTSAGMELLTPAPEEILSLDIE